MGRTVGESGRGKSPSMEFAIAPLSAIEQRAYAAYARDKEDAAQAIVAAMADGAVPKPSGEKIAPPPRLLLANSTIEALGVQYARTEHRVLLHRDARNS
jgi:hypothetical protein